VAGKAFPRMPPSRRQLATSLKWEASGPLRSTPLVSCPVLIGGGERILFLIAQVFIQNWATNEQKHPSPSPMCPPL
jgi:hypothetical protein